MVAFQNWISPSCKLEPVVCRTLIAGLVDLAKLTEPA